MIIFDYISGNSEENTRRAIQLAEAVAPCILQLDEIEKGFAGARAGELDSGVTARMFGTFLTWMQEKTAPVVVLATANDITSLPPELLRKGRFDELFLMDLPNRQERVAILAAHLNLRHRHPESFDLDAVAGQTEGFSGAELEQVVKEALLDAFGEGREVESNDLLNAVKRTVPLSQTMAEQIAALRDWGRNRARPASDRAESRRQTVASIEL